MSIATLKRAVLAVVLAVAAGGVAGCDDASVGIDEQTPTGLVVLDAQGNQVASFNGAGTSGSIRLSVGAQQTFRVRLVGQGGAQLAIDGSRYTLRPIVLTVPIAGVALDGPDRIVITGRSAGPTNLVLTVLRNGTAVFADAVVPLTVS